MNGSGRVFGASLRPHVMAFGFCEDTPIAARVCMLFLSDVSTRTKFPLQAKVCCVTLRAYLEQSTYEPSGSSGSE
jgi:hypothetical protein